jgi:hypothetical protein
MKIRTRLVVLIVSALLPIVVFGAVMTARFWDLQRTSYEQQFLERVRALRLALDTELESTIRALDSLSRSSEADSGGEAFAARLQRMVAAQSAWATMGLAEPDGTVVVHANQPRLTQDVTIDRDTVDRGGIGQGAAHLQSGRSPRRDVPDLRRRAVIRDGTAVKVVYAGVDHASWLAFLRRYPIAERATLTLNDRNGIIIARHAQRRALGGIAPPRHRSSRVPAACPKRPSATWVSKARRSTPRSAAPAYRGGCSAPAYRSRTWSRALMGSTVLTLGGFAIAALAALLLAFVFGRRIAAAVTSLAASARSLAESDRAPATPPRGSPHTRRDRDRARRHCTSRARSCTSGSSRSTRRSCARRRRARKPSTRTSRRTSSSPCWVTSCATR